MRKMMSSHGNTRKRRSALSMHSIVSKSFSALPPANEDRLAFTQIFRHHHRDYAYNAGTSFNLTVLEILVLLNMRAGQSSGGHSRNGSNSLAGSAAISMLQQWLDEQSRFLEDRRQWLEHRERLGRPNDSDLPSPKEDILDEIAISSWATFQEAHIEPKGSHRTAPLFGVLHRFMLLSSTIAPEVGDINQKWMELALQLMFQSALEVLSSPEQSDGHAAANEDPATNGHSVRMPGLIECFAFGYLSRIAKSRTVSETEQSINALFTSTTQGSHDQVENPDWTQLRSEFLAEFRLPNSPTPSSAFRNSTRTGPTPDPKVYHARIARLKHKHPFEEVEAKLLQCLGHFWILNCSDEVSGKPVLVQIEEGRLERLDEKEFDDFLVRVGLQRDNKGPLSFRSAATDEDERKDGDKKT